MTARNASVQWRVSALDVEQQSQHGSLHPDPTRFAMAVLGSPDSPTTPSKRLLDFMPLDMLQVQRSIMERQAVASGATPSGGLALRHSTFSEAHMSRGGGLGGAQASARHRTSFYALPADSEAAASDDGSDADFPSLMARGKSAPDLEAMPSQAQSEFAEDEVADAIDLAMLPRRHGRMLQAQMGNVPQQPRGRLKEVMKQLMTSPEASSQYAASTAAAAAAEASKAAAANRPNTSYSTAHLSGANLCSTALSAIARAERMLQKLHDKSGVVSLEIDSRPASRAPEQPIMLQGELAAMEHVTVSTRQGPSDTALHIANRIHAKAKMWANTTTRPDSPSIAKASQPIMGRHEKRSSDGDASIISDGSGYAGMASVLGSMLNSHTPGSSRRSSNSKVFQPLQLRDMRSRSIVKRQPSMQRSGSQKRRDSNNAVSSLLEDEDNLNLVNAARKRLELMEKSMFNVKAAELEQREAHAGEQAASPTADSAAAAAGSEGRSGADAEGEKTGGAAATARQGGGAGSQPEGLAEEPSDPSSGRLVRMAPPSREGAMFSGVFGRVTDMRRKLHKEKAGLMRNNPAAFQEDVAAQAEAEYRAMSERAHTKYRTAVTHLMEPRMVEDFKKAIKQLQSERPYFLPPIYERDRVERAPVRVVRRPSQARWAVERSVFFHRRKETEARDLYDTEQVATKQFNLDWQRVAAKVRFRKLVGREDKSVHSDGQRLEEELTEVREEVFKFKDKLRAMFMYYSSKSSGPLGSEFMLNMGLSDWLSFCADADIVDNAKRGCTSTDMQNVFVAVNFEEDSETQESGANDDDAMMRFEFYEGIVRAAFGRFITTGAMTDASDATQRFIVDVILPRMPPEALIDTNDFRRNRLYTEPMALLLEDNWDFLFAMYKMYKAKDRTKFFWVEHWAVLLESVQLLGPTTGLERKEAKLIFVWSQLIVTDELRRRKRAVGLLFIDFVEALARVADFLSPPSLAELQAFAHGPSLDGDSPKAKLPPDVHPLTEYFKQRGSDKKRPASASLLGPATRPLHVKFETLMDYMVHQLRQTWGGKDRADCAAKMLRVCMMLGSGIELG